MGTTASEIAPYGCITQLRRGLRWRNGGTQFETAIAQPNGFRPRAHKKRLLTSLGYWQTFETWQRPVVMFCSPTS